MNKELTKEQYEAAHSIMGFCRIFVDQMSKCLDNSGLRKLGYHLDLDFDPYGYEDGSVALGKVTIEKNPSKVGGDEWYDTIFICRHYADERGWMVDNDPYTKGSVLPEDIRYPEDGDVSESVAEETEHPYPPDGFWVGTDYCDPVLDGGQ